MSKIQSRLLAITLLLAATVALAALVYFPFFLLHRSYDRTLSEQLDHLGRYRSALAARPELQNALDELKKQNSRRFFLKNSGHALAASEIQEMAKNLIESSGGKMISNQVGQHKEDGPYRRVTVNFQLTCSMPAFKRILHTLENSQPYLFVDNINIRSQLNSQYKAVPGIEPEMSVQFDLAGYALGGDAK